METKPAVEKGSKLFDAIGVFERRRAALQERLDKESGSRGSLSYDRHEVEAINIALDAIRLQWAQVRRLDTPITVLESLAEAVRSGSQPKIQASLARADEVLEAYE